MTLIVKTVDLPDFKRDDPTSHEAALHPASPARRPSADRRTELRRQAAMLLRRFTF